MGAGNRLDCDFELTDIFKTKNDPFARKLRRELKTAGVDKLDVVCATSPPFDESGRTRVNRRAGRSLWAR